MTRLWDKGEPLDALVHRFTVGDDPELDRHLVHWDCLGSAAHARTLERAKILTPSECGELIEGLAEIDASAADGRFEIPRELEDCHTAIEARLTERCGDVGKKIHAGRSRNDQVATAMRLFMRHHTLAWLAQLGDFAKTALVRLDRDGDVPMPGYTHLRPAMPSSVGQWLHAQIEAALEQMRAAFDLLDRLDCCPLGTGAGFGVPLPLDRALSAKLLGFSRVQRSPIDVQNSRGRMETYFVRVAADVGAMLEKLSWDMILFSMPEFGFFALPDSMTTGSSIMPQKRNPDVLELLRAGGGRLHGRLAELRAVCGKLPSSYHRDLQLTKAPAVRTATELSDMLQIATEVVRSFSVNRDTLARAMRPELYATHAALALVRGGAAFRDAYRTVAEKLKSGQFEVGEREQAGRAEPDNVRDARAELEELAARAAEISARIRMVEAGLLV